MLVLTLNLARVPGLLKVIGDVNIPSGSSCHGVLDNKSLLPSLWVFLPFWEETDGRFTNTWVLAILFTLLDQAWERQQAATMLMMTLAHCLRTSPSMHSSSPFPDEQIRYIVLCANIPQVLC